MADKELVGNVRQAWASAKAAVFKAAIPEGGSLPDMDVVRAAFHDEYGEIADAISSGGYAEGEKKLIGKSKAITKKLEETEAERDQLRTELETAHAKAPDAERLRKSFEQQLSKAEEKAREQIDALSGQLSTMRQDRDLGAFEKDLMEAGLKPRAAAAYRAIHAKNFDYDDDGKPVVKHPETGVPFIVAKGAPWSPLVKQLREKADPDDVKATVDTRGAGAIRRGYGSESGAGRAPLSNQDAALAKKIERDGRGLSGL